jgi:peptide/nickel transport system substrate-binding protein
MASTVSQANKAPLAYYAGELTRRQTLALFGLAIGLGATAPGRAAPAGQLAWGLHISLAPTWFDPAETSGIVTPYMVLYALHDALVKPMPGEPLATSLAIVV